MVRAPDTLVVGAGIVGLSTAYWLAKAGQKVMGGADPRRELGKVGLLAEGLMKKAMSDGIPPPLADSTVKRH